MVLGSGPSKSREFSWRRAARVLRAPRRTTRPGRGHQTGGMVCPDMMRVAWASSRFHTRMRGAAVELPVSGQTRHGSRSPAGGRAGCHERSRTGVAAGGNFARTRCASCGLSAGPVLARAALLWCSPAAFQIRHGGLFARHGMALAASARRRALVWRAWIRVRARADSAIVPSEQPPSPLTQPQQRDVEAEDDSSGRVAAGGVPACCR